MTFGAQLLAAKESMIGDINRIWKDSVVRAFTYTVQRTPVLTGQARRSWLMGDANSGDIGSVEIDISSLKIPEVGGSILLYSNLPYIERLEEGWSAQAPAGMVKVTINQWPLIVKAST